MNSLEWINKQIEDCNKVIEHLKMRIIEDKKYPSLVKAHMEEIENITQLKEHFEKIKSKLETLKILKKELNLKIVEHKCSAFQTIYGLKCDYTGVIPLLDEEVELCKVALEEKDE